MKTIAAITLLALIPPALIHAADQASVKLNILDTVTVSGIVHISALRLQSFQKAYTQIKLRIRTD